MASPQSTSNRIYFPYLDVVRFIAAFMIIIYHGYGAWRGWFGEIGFLSSGTYTTLSPGGRLIHQLIQNFEIGVDVFFLLSGFLITYILIKEKEHFGKVNVFNFIVRRSLRIWPLYFLLIAIAPFIVSWVDTDSPNYLVNALFVNNFHTINIKDWIYPFAHFWSICIEEHFYIVWPFVIAFIPNKYLMKVFISLIMISIAFRMYSVITMDEPWFTLYLHTLSRMDVLIIGAIGAYYYAKKPFEIRLNRYFRILLWVVLIGVFCVEPVVNWNSVFLGGFKKFFYIGVISTILLDYNFNPRFKHLVKPRSIFHYFGKISYGIYMYGNILLLIIMKKIMLKWSIDNLYVYMLIVVGLSLIVPIISYELIERPILKLKSRFALIKTQR